MSILANYPKLITSVKLNKKENIFLLTLVMREAEKFHDPTVYDKHFPSVKYVCVCVCGWMRNYQYLYYVQVDYCPRLCCCCYHRFQLFCTPSGVCQTELFINGGKLFSLQYPYLGISCLVLF